MADIDIKFENIYDPIDETPTKKLLDKKNSDTTFSCNYVYNCLFNYCCFSYSSNIWVNH